MRFQSTMLSSFSLLLSLPLLCVGASASFFTAASVDPMQEYPILSPDEVSEQFPGALEQFELELQPLGSPEVKNYDAVAPEVWAQVDRFHHILFLFLVYYKAGIYGTDNSLREKWAEVQDRLYEDYFQDHEFHHPGRCIFQALGYPAYVDLYVICKASHSICEAKTAPLLGSMSFLARKMLQIWLRLFRILHLASGSPDPESESLVQAEINAIRDLTALCKEHYQEYLLARQQAALDVNTQAILQATLGSIRTFFNLDSNLDKFSPLVKSILKRSSDTGMPKSFHSMVKELGEILTDDFKLGIPIGEKLGAAWNSEYGSLLEEAAELAGWEDYLQLSSRAVDSKDKLLLWIAEEIERGIGFNIEGFDKTGVTPIDRLPCPWRDMSSEEPLPSGGQALVWLNDLSTMLLKLEINLLLAQSWLPKAQLCWMIVHCHYNSEASPFRNCIDFRNELKRLAKNFKNVQKDLQFFSNGSFELKERQQIRFQQKLEACQARFQEIGRKYNALILEFERLPQWVVFETRPKTLSLMQQ